jgi:hypothetical protein
VPSTRTTVLPAKHACSGSSHADGSGEISPRRGYFSAGIELKSAQLAVAIAMALGARDHRAVALLEEDAAHTERAEGGLAACHFRLSVCR